MSDETIAVVTGEEQVAQAVAETIGEKRRVFSIADIPNLTNTVNKRWLTVPEWGSAEVCVWGTTVGDTVRIESDAKLAGADEMKAAARRQIATIIETCRDGDTPEASRLFRRDLHWGWLEAQPSSVLDALYGCVRDMDSDGSTRQAMVDFLGIPELVAEVAQLKSCLTNIASVSGSCTDCHQNSPETCPLLS
jgi:hypothetical protein